RDAASVNKLHSAMQNFTSLRNSIEMLPGKGIPASALKAFDEFERIKIFHSPLNRLIYAIEKCIRAAEQYLQKLEIAANFARRDTTLNIQLSSLKKRVKDLKTFLLATPKRVAAKEEVKKDESSKGPTASKKVISSISYGSNTNASTSD